MRSARGCSTDADGSVNALQLGASDQLAGLIQVAASAAATAGVWIVFRREAGQAAAAALAVAAVLASPYAFF